MRRILIIKSGLIFVFTFLMFAIISAQNVNQTQKSKMSSEDIAAKETEMMKKNLSLTPEQESKVKKINLDYANRMKHATKDERDLLEGEKDAELKAALKPDQYSKWESNKKTWVDDLKKTWKQVKEGTKDGAEKVKDGVEDLTK